MSLGTARTIAIAEAVSYLALLAAVVAKRGFGVPEGVSMVGPIHGLLFLAYLGAVLQVRAERGWSAQQTLPALAASVVPFGGVWVERRLSRIPEPLAPDSQAG